MPTPVQEILMLLGAKVVEVHEKDKEIRYLTERVNQLESEAQRAGLRDARPRDSEN